MHDMVHEQTIINFCRQSFASHVVSSLPVKRNNNNNNNDNNNNNNNNNNYNNYNNNYNYNYNYSLTWGF